MPRLYARLNKVVNDAEDLPDYCRWKDQYIEEVTAIRDNFEEVRDGLYGDSNLKIKIVDDPDEQGAEAYWQWGKVHFNTHDQYSFFEPDMTHEKKKAVVALSFGVLFHELIHKHMGGEESDGAARTSLNTYTYQRLFTKQEPIVGMVWDVVGYIYATIASDRALVTIFKNCCEPWFRENYPR